MACAACGRCCTFVEFEGHPSPTSDERTWLDYHDFLVEEVEECGEATAKIIVQVPCKMLDKSTMKCTVYDERPNVCRLFLCSDARKEG